MHRFIPLLVTVVAALWPLMAGQSAEPDPSLIKVPVEGADTLAIRLPTGWKTGDNKSERTSPVLLDLSSPGGLQIKLAIIADADGRFSTAEALDELVTMASQQFIANAIEQTPKLTRLTPKVGLGAYCTFTDSRLVGVTSPAEGEFRNVTSGVYVIGKHAVIFTILSNTVTGPEFQTALDLISSGISVALGGT